MCVVSCWLRDGVLECLSVIASACFESEIARIERTRGARDGAFGLCGDWVQKWMGGVIGFVARFRVVTCT